MDATRSTRISLTWKNVTAVVFLSFIMQETHEIAHTAVGRLVCGCWGGRNFNVWGLCSECAHPELSLLSTLAGPIYTFGVIWIGYYLLTRSGMRGKSVGFALIVSSMPFSRVLTPLFGGGDTIYVLTEIGVSHAVAWPLTLLLVSALALLPVAAIYRRIANPRRGAWIAGLLLVPFFLVGLVVFGILQNLLRAGVLDSYWILGSPVLVTLWLFLSVAVFLAFAPHLLTLLQPASSPAPLEAPAPAPLSRVKPTP